MFLPFHWVDDRSGLYMWLEWRYVIKYRSVLRRPEETRNIRMHERSTCAVYDEGIWVLTVPEVSHVLGKRIISLTIKLYIFNNYYKRREHNTIQKNKTQRYMSLSSSGMLHKFLIFSAPILQITCRIVLWRLANFFF